MKILIGGSPCTHWSIAQTKNRETEASGIGWELFRNYKIALEKYNPDYFLYENNKSMSSAIRAQITAELGVEPIQINSALVSAQNRQRLYWTNILNVAQPDNKGIFLCDILEFGGGRNEKGCCLKANYGKSSARNFIDGQHFPAPGAIHSVCAAERGRYTGSGGVVEQHYEPRADGKTNTLPTVQKDNQVMTAVRAGIMPTISGALNDNQGSRIYCVDAKSVSIKANGGGGGAKTGLYACPVECASCPLQDYPIYEVAGGEISIKGRKHPIKLADGLYVIRKLTVTECKRLQTVPDGYRFPVSDEQAYKMLGNGWTVDVIAHIMSYIPAISVEPVNVLSMYDGMACGHIALDKLGAKIQSYHATEIDKWAVETAVHNFPDITQLGDAFQVRDDGFCINT